MHSSAISTKTLAQVARKTLVLMLLALWLLPLFGVALTSIRTIEDLNRGNFWGWPGETQFLENYAAVLGGHDMPRLILNSFVITVPAVAGTLILSTMAGFALATYRFRANLLLLALFIGGNLVPFQILAIPVRSLMLDAFGLYDTRSSLILFHISFQLGFATLFMRNFTRQLPSSLVDTARVEGVSEWRILVYVVAPLLRPAMAAVAVLVFTFVWNDFFWSLILAHSSAVRPVTVGLQTLRGMWITSWHLLSAASLLAAIPPAALFFLMQRHFIAGLTLGMTGD
jgi:multiple sugar transport system permease protein